MVRSLTCFQHVWSEFRNRGAERSTVETNVFLTLRVREAWPVRMKSFVDGTSFPHAEREEYFLDVALSLREREAWSPRGMTPLFGGTSRVPLAEREGYIFAFECGCG